MQLTPQIPSQFQELFQQPTSLPSNLFEFKQHLVQRNRIKYLKMSLDRPPSESQSVMTKYSYRTPSQHRDIGNDQSMSIRPVFQRHVKTLQFSPEVSPPPQSSQKKNLGKLLKQQSPQNVQYKFKVYSQEYRNNNKYVQERREFEKQLNEKMQSKLEQKHQTMREHVDQYKRELRKVDQKKLLPIQKLLDLRLKNMNK